MTEEKDLQCGLCGQICKRGVHITCCKAIGCRACCTKAVTRDKKCWVASCGAAATTKDLINDDELRKKVDEFLASKKVEEETPVLPTPVASLPTPVPISADKNSAVSSTASDDKTVLSPKVDSKKTTASPKAGANKTETPPSPATAKTSLNSKEPSTTTSSPNKTSADTPKEEESKSSLTPLGGNKAETKPSAGAKKENTPTLSSIKKFNNPVKSNNSQPVETPVQNNKQPEKAKKAENEPPVKKTKMPNEHEKENVNVQVNLDMMKQRNIEFDQNLNEVERESKELRYGAILELMFTFSNINAKCRICSEEIKSDFMVLKHIQMKHKDLYQNFKVVLSAPNLNQLNLCLHKAIKAEFLFAQKGEFPIPVDY